MPPKGAKERHSAAGPLPRVGLAEGRLQPWLTGRKLAEANFVSGDFTNNSPLLFAEISDEQGVNFTGHSLGRDITMVLNEEWSNSMVMNDYFELDVDTFKEGKLSYLFDNLFMPPSPLSTLPI